jgi:hypothetical protein
VGGVRVRLADLGDERLGRVDRRGGCGVADELRAADGEFGAPTARERPVGVGVVRSPVRTVPVADAVETVRGREPATGWTLLPLLLAREAGRL